MAAAITTELIFSRLQSEKATGELASLPRDFYSQTNTFVLELEKGEATEDRNKQLENARKMLFALKEKRKQKLLTYLAFGKPLPQPIPDEEEVLYNEIRQLLSNGASRKVPRLKIITSIPEVLTTEGRKIGPYQQGDIVEVRDSSDVEFMIKNRIAEQVN